MSKPRALLLSPEPPWPAHGGGPLRTLSILEYLREKYLLDLILFHDPEEPRPEAPPGVAQRVLILDLERHSKKQAARTARNLSRLLRGVAPLSDRFSGFAPAISAWLSGQHYETAVIEHSWCGGYWFLLKDAARRKVLDLHNLEGRLLDRLAARRGGVAKWVLGEFARRCESEERRWLKLFDTVLAASDADAERCRALAPEARLAVVPNTLPWIEPARPERDTSLVMAANFGYEPNSEGARWFARAVWPALRSRFLWRLVGRGSEEMRVALGGDEHILATGRVDNAVAWMARSQAAVVPIFSGSGTRIKILEAWAAGVPVVTTPLGAEGLRAENGVNLLFAESAEQFRERLEWVTGDAAAAEKLSRSGRVTYEVEYTWPAAWAGLERAGV